MGRSYVLGAGGGCSQNCATQEVTTFGKVAKFLAGVDVHPLIHPEVS